jgi:AcrR family transcriptional regulator
LITIADFQKNVYTVYVMHTSGRILRAAWRLYQRHGEAGVSIRRVAETVGLSAMAIYRHYASRDALLAALTAESFVAWEARVRAIRARAPVAWLGRLGEAYLRFALDEPRRFEACFELPSRTVRKIPSDFVAGRSPAVRVIDEHVAAGLARGELVGPDALTIALVLWGESHGLIRLYRDGRFENERVFERMYRRCMRLVLSAFVTRRPA